MIDCSSGGNDPKDPVCRAVSSTVVISPENKLLLPCYHFKKDEDAVPIENNLYDIYRFSPAVRRGTTLSDGEIIDFVRAQIYALSKL